VAQAAEKLPETEAVLPIEPRKFNLPDFETHGIWLIPRMCETFPSLSPRSAANFLRGILYANDYKFMFLPNAVALAQTVKDFMLDPMPTVRERFVWCQDREDKIAQVQAAAFYDEFAKWARWQGCETMIVEESSDVPHDLIREKLGRVLMRQQSYVRF